jgi:hypothetical protein
MLILSKILSCVSDSSLSNFCRDICFMLQLSVGA